MNANYSKTVRIIDTEQCEGLPCGQWVQFDWLSKPSRFIGKTIGGGLVATHWPHNSPAHFQAKVAYWKGVRA